MKIYPILILSIFLTGCGGIGDREVFYKITAKINGHKNSDLEKSDIVITTPNYFTKYEDLNQDLLTKKFKPLEVVYDKSNALILSEAKFFSPFIFWIIPPIGAYPKTANLPIIFVEFAKCKKRWVLHFKNDDAVEYALLDKAGVSEINNDKKLFGGNLKKLKEQFGWDVELKISLDDLPANCI